VTFYDKQNILWLTKVWWCL